MTARGGRRPSIADVRHAIAARLASMGDDARLDATRILESVLATTHARLLSHGNEPVPDSLLARIVAAVDRRASGEPLAYILGECGFYGRSFLVDRNVLVPRPETELLVEAILAAAPASPIRVCDIGTGSGAIAVTLACERPNWHIDAYEISPEAAAVARRNAAALGAVITIVEQDFRSAFLPAAQALADASGTGSERSSDPRPATNVLRYDVVAANLPYIPTATMPYAPQPESFEPVLALDGGADGLDLYRALAERITPYLATNFLLIAEAAPPTMPGLLELFTAHFPQARISSRDDYAGLARFAVVEHGTLGSDISQGA